jgi:hypothetical protein
MMVVVIGDALCHPKRVEVELVDWWKENLTLNPFRKRDEAILARFALRPT